MRRTSVLRAAAWLFAALVFHCHAERTAGHASPQQAEASPSFGKAPGMLIERRLPPLASPAGPKATGESRRAIGVNRVLFDESLAPLGSRDLSWSTDADGSRVARFRVVSEGARGLRVAFRFADGASGIQLRFASAAEGARVVGPVSGSAGLVWGPILLGDAVVVEARADATLDMRREWFTVPEVSHLFASPVPTKAVGDAASCERDVKCYALNDAARDNAKATALLFVTNANGTFGCSAVLMNTSPYSGTPYVLTTSYCVNDAAEAATVNTLWDYEATACGSNTAQAFTRRTGGATIVARNTAKRYTFLKLNEPAPSNVFFSGWDGNAQAAGGSVAAVHHPMSDLKKMSTGNIAAAGVPLLARFSSGVTESGSVGSGLFVDDQYFVGLMYDGESSCTNPSGLDQYSPFSDFIDELRSYLQPAASVAVGNLSDIWWNPSESGWGLTIADHETQIFAVWYTYRADGSPTWFVIPGGSFTQGRRLFSGAMYQTTGPAYNAPFNPGAVTTRPAGSVTIDFAPPPLAAGNALFTYTVGNVTRSVQIQRQSFGDAPADWTNDVTDIWWDPNESGWGMTLSQHGNNVFGVWYTYDTSGQPIFAVMPGVRFTGATSFTGDLFTTTGPYYGNPSFDASQVRVTPAGTASVSFDSFMGPNGSKHGTFTSTFRNYTQVKHITGQPFGNPSPATPSPATPKMQLVVSLAGAGTGAVVSSPAGINCGGGGACAASFPKGTSVTLTATPASGSRFVSFTGTCSTPSSSCSMFVSANSAVTVTFDKLPPPSNLAIAIVPLRDAVAGQFYSEIVATGSGGSPPYHFQSDTFANGTPPPGMVVTLDGHLQGTPSTTITTATTYTFGVCVVDLAATSRCAQASVRVGPPSSTIKWQVGDQCNNGQEIWYKFYDRAHSLVWPGATTHYPITNGQTFTNTLACTSGALVCIGARTADGRLSWGVGFDGTSGCPDCCGTCDGRTYAYSFGCNSPPPPSGPGQCTGLLGGPRACQACNSDADCGGNVCWTGAKPAPFCG